MSQRVIGYEGEGRHRVPVYEDLGPASAGAVSGLEAAGRLSAIDIRGTDRPEGAGPVERRQIRAAEAAVRREASPTQRAWNRKDPIGASASAPSPPPPTELPMPEMPPQPAQDGAEPSVGADVQLDCLSVAAEVARQAWDGLAVAQTAWQVASEALARAYDDVVWLLDVPTVSDSPANHASDYSDPIPELVPKPKPGGNTAAQSRANGTASMLAKRAPKTSAVPKAKAEKTYKRSPETRERMRQGQRARIERIKAETAAKVEAGG